MSALVIPSGARGRGLARLAVVGAILLAGLAFAADRAQAAYSAQVVNGTLTITGNGASDQLALRLQAGVPTTLQVDVGDNGSADFSFDRATFDRIVVNAGSGDDLVRIDQVNGVFTDTETTTIDGQGDDDTLLGGSGVEILRGGAQNDFVDGNAGNDTGILGTGRDTFVWDPGDGSDTIEGEGGTDTLVFNGSGGNENFDFSANGPRFRFFRDLGNITMDTDDVEKVKLDALGGADNAVVNNLAGTDVTLANIDLEGVLGGGLGDGAPDNITVKGTAGADLVDASSDAGLVEVDGLAADVLVKRAEQGSDRLAIDGLGGGDLVKVFGSSANDLIDIAPSPVAGNARVTASNIPAFVDLAGVATLAVKGLAGDDTISGTSGLAALLSLRLYGGSGEDELNGGDGIDQLFGGAQNDAVDGNAGNDVGILGTGRDTFVWDPGDGSDTVEGQGGTDTLLFNGSGGNENFDFSANGPRFRFFRDLGNITMDTDDVEQVDLNALGGADNAVVNNLAGTDVTLANIDLEGVLGGGLGDGQPDNITVNGSNASDNIRVRADGDIVDVTGLAPRVQIEHSEALLDRLTVNGLGGNDKFAIGVGVDTLIQLTTNQ
ncbi:MAG: calcium-binding protein [Gaiellaceae bacterium]